VPVETRDSFGPTMPATIHSVAAQHASCSRSSARTAANPDNPIS